jgi:hypothetical protein
MSKRSSTAVARCFLLDLPDELQKEILKHLIDPVEFQGELPMSFLRFAVTTKKVFSWRFDTNQNVIQPLWDGYSDELSRERDAISDKALAYLEDESLSLLPFSRFRCFKVLYNEVEILDHLMDLCHRVNFTFMNGWMTV